MLLRPFSSCLLVVSPAGAIISRAMAGSREIGSGNCPIGRLDPHFCPAAGR